MLGQSLRPITDTSSREPVRCLVFTSLSCLMFLLQGSHPHLLHHLQAVYTMTKGLLSVCFPCFIPAVFNSLLSTIQSCAQDSLTTYLTSVRVRKPQPFHLHPVARLLQLVSQSQSLMINLFYGLVSAPCYKCIPHDAPSESIRSASCKQGAASRGSPNWRKSEPA